MYAVIQKTKTVNQPSSSNLSTKSHHDHKHDTEDVDSMYNETIFTVSTSLPQQNISNYDTMENILDNLFIIIQRSINLHRLHQALMSVNLYTTT
jgi:hypothetical protein